MKRKLTWYKFRTTSPEFNEADCVVPVDKFGNEFEISSDRLQRKTVVGYKWRDPEDGLKILEVVVD